MQSNVLSILKYETFIAPGAYFHLYDEKFESDAEMKSIIIDQSNVFSKLVSIYPEGFIMYLEQTPKGSIYRTNYPITLDEKHGHYLVNWDGKE